MKTEYLGYRLAKTVFLLLVATLSTIQAVEPAKTSNGAFLEDSFVVNIGPTLNFFAPVENMVTPEDYFRIIGVLAEKIDESSYRISPGEYTTLAQAYQQLQDHGIYTVNPIIESLQLERLFHPEIIGPPFQLSQTWNFSVRSEVKEGESISVGGLVIPGKHPKIVVIRALGPTLGDYGIENPLEDPEISLIRNNSNVRADPTALLPEFTEILNNDDHLNSYISTDTLLEWTGIKRPSHENESLIATILDPGMYTTSLSSANGETGIGLLEFYILDAVDVTNTPLID